MRKRYTDDIQKNELDFIIRKYNDYYLIIILLLTIVTLSISFILLANTDIVKIALDYTHSRAELKYALIALTIFLNFAIILVFKRMHVIIAATEFQNMLFSNSIKKLCSFYLIYKNNGNVFYKDERANNILNCEQKTIRIFDPAGKEKVINLQDSCRRDERSLNAAGYTINIIQISRPDGYLLISGHENREIDIYNTMLDQAGICTYKCNPKSEIVTECNASYKKYFNTKHIKKNIITLAKGGRYLLLENHYLVKNNVKYGAFVAKTLQLNEILSRVPLPIALFDKKLNLIDSNREFAEISSIQSNGNISSAIKNKLLFNPNEQLMIVELSFKNGNHAKAYITRFENIFIGIFTDFNDVKDLQKKLEHSQKVSSIGELTGGIAHDFNNILTAILGFCEILLRDINEKSEFYFDIYQIKNSAEKGSQLVKKLLAFARRQNLNTEVSNINEIIDQLHQIMQRLIDENIKLEYYLSGNVKPVKIDKCQFEQILINLVINARDAIHGSGRLTFRTSTVIISANSVVLRDTHYQESMLKGEYSHLSIKDNGCGMTKDILVKIFDPFFSTKEIDGSGLGLSTVYGIVKQFKGYIDVKSSINQGTKFDIFIPVCYEEMPKKQISNEPQPLVVKKLWKILLVEDEQIVRHFLQKMLERHGFNVVIPQSSKDAISRFKKSPVDLIITDVVMPELSGPEMIEEIQKIKSDIKVIFISGYTKEKLQIEHGNKNHFFLEKPFQTKDLLNIISRAIDCHK